MKKTALVIIDLQKDYFPGGKFPLYDIMSVAENSKELLAVVRKKGIPVIHVQHQFMEKDAPFFVSGTEGVKIHESVQPLEGEEVIVKNYPNAFKDTSLKAMLDRNQYSRLIVIGAMAQMCIDATVRAALDNGYQTVLIHDAVASHDAQFENVEVSAPLVQAAFMHALSLAGAVMLDKDRFIQQLEI